MTLIDHNTTFKIGKLNIDFLTFSEFFNHQNSKTQFYEGFFWSFLVFKKHPFFKKYFFYFSISEFIKRPFSIILLTLDVDFSIFSDAFQISQNRFLEKNIEQILIFENF